MSLHGTSSKPADAGEVADAPRLTGLRNIRTMLDSTSRVAQLADALRQKIIDGELPPGTQLAEQSAAEALGVSRNTLREAFRLLSHERLLVHQVHRGVFVRTLEPADVREIYTTRRLIECAAVEYGAERATTGTRPPEHDVRAIRDAVAEGLTAAANDEWSAVGTADLRFHSAITALAGSRHLDDLMRRMLAELRLAFHVMSDPRRFHKPYLQRNDQITGLLERGENSAAATALRAYFDDAETQLLTAMAEGATEARP